MNYEHAYQQFWVHLVTVNLISLISQTFHQSSTRKMQHLQRLKGIERSDLEEKSQICHGALLDLMMRR